MGAQRTGWVGGKHGGWGMGDRGTGDWTGGEQARGQRAQGTVEHRAWGEAWGPGWHRGQGSQREEAPEVFAAYPTPSCHDWVRVSTALSVTDKVFEGQTLPKPIPQGSAPLVI